jgi:cellulose synthase operon protein C
MTLSSGLPFIVGVLVLGTATAATAKPSEPTGERPTEPRSLRSLFGVDAVRPGLHAEAGAVRERAFARLGTFGTPRALELLARALDADGAARDARERLAVVRALAPHAADPTVEDALIRALGGDGSHLDERALLVERTAALALAKSREQSALQALAQALRQPGRVSEHARLALRAHPPDSVAPLLEASGAATPALVTLLGELGDVRARAFLEKQATDSDAALRAAAVTALFRLDHARGLALARRAATTETEPSVRAEILRVLAQSGDPAAARVFAELLADPAGRSSALELALDVENRDFGALLVAAGPAGDTDRWLAALGHTGGTQALAELERVLARPDDAWSALYALALSPDADADAAITRALSRPALRRDALRAATLRAVARERTVAGMTSAAAALEHGDAADRAAAAWSQAVLEPDGAAPLVASRDTAIVRAVARATTAPELAAAAARRLATEPDPGLESALAVSLAVPGAADQVPTHILVALLEARGAATYVAAFALALRDSETLRPLLRELLASDDPVLRAHVALGLAASAEPSSVGVLADAYRTEVDASVRRAIVRALAARTETGRRATLELAAALEPDDDARALARAALAAQNPPSGERRGTAWFRLTPTPADPLFALVEAPGGLALPFASDPDGSVTVTGLLPGDVELSLATATPGRVPHQGATP